MFGIEYDESLGYWENQVLDGVAIVVGIPVLPFVLVAEVFGWKILDAPSASDCKSRAQTQVSSWISHGYVMLLVSAESEIRGSRVGEVGVLGCEEHEMPGIPAV